MSDTKTKEVAGCLGAVLAMFVTLPMWLVLLFGILSRVDAPVWMWGLYWAYIPTSLCIASISIVVKLMDE